MILMFLNLQQEMINRPHKILKKLKIDKKKESRKEIIEYKSNGHPDTLTDLCVEACASALDEYYLKKYGRVLHYNVDKAIFLAGDAKIWFGGGKIIKPPCFILGGQVSNLTSELKRLLEETIKPTIKKHLPNLQYFNIEIRSGNISQNLGQISKDKRILSNDTSFGVGYYPYSSNELKVLKIKKELDKMIKMKEIPLGELYKILLTPKMIYISAPLYAQKISSHKEYVKFKKEIESKLSSYGKIIFNPDFEKGFPYLTLTGSSIECGDDGQVGRSNRYNGLITPCRPMTLEAFHGKNNRNHIGKLYSKWAFQMAKRIYKKTGKYTEVILVGKIGESIKKYEKYVFQNL